MMFLNETFYELKIKTAKRNLKGSLHIIFTIQDQAKFPSYSSEPFTMSFYTQSMEMSTP